MYRYLRSVCCAACFLVLFRADRAQSSDEVDIEGGQLVPEAAGLYISLSTWYDTWKNTYAVAFLRKPLLCEFPGYRV